MASPQRENGFIAIATELWRALCKIRVPGEARQVLDVIFWKTYGFQKKEDRISLSQFMEITGINDKGSIRRAIEKLKVMNMVVGKKAYDGDTSYSIQKDYEKWTPLKRGEAKKPTVGEKAYEGEAKKPTSQRAKKPTTKDNIKDNSKDSTTCDVIQKDNAASPTSICQKYFYDKYYQTFKEKYVADFGKDGAIFKNLTKVLAVDRVKQLIDKFFNLEDQFISEKAGYTTGTFKINVNKLISTKGKYDDIPESLREFYKDGPVSGNNQR